mmetsp:Transcript_22997/g.11119  ORF Transcript_22997/g.11119 Transcript_22997/m.11119 type:complete len:431 (+) Transcript_22997:471-1763(+)
MLILIKEGRFVDPGCNIDEIADVYIKDDRILFIKKPEEKVEISEHEIDRIINAKSMVVTAGLIDMHVHFREPGYEHKETIETGCLAAIKGGFTAVCTMPNTNPVNDCRQVTEYIIKKAQSIGLNRIYPVGAVTIGSKGEKLCIYSQLKKAGAVALSDDGSPVSNSLVMKEALKLAKVYKLPIISHSEDLSIVGSGVMNYGFVSKRLGLSGIPNAAESAMVMRDLDLCEQTGSHLHIAHLSTKESVDAIRNAKKRGVKVTAETAPHYFTLTDEAVEKFSTNAKVNPPLRSEKDRDGIREGLVDETIDVIACDHAPHLQVEKNTAFDLAPNGIIGLETSLALGLKLVREKIISLNSLIKKMHTNPAHILKMEHELKPGALADITIIDTEKEFSIKASEVCSKSINTPFDGWKFTGKAVCTIVGGKIVYWDEY